MPVASVRFPGSQGQQLAALLDAPPDAARAYALFAHCFTCSKDSKAATYVAQALAAQGIATLRFDFTGIRPFISSIPCAGGTRAGSAVAVASRRAIRCKEFAGGRV